MRGLLERIARRLGGGISGPSDRWPARSRPQPSLAAIIREAERRDIPWVPWPRQQMIQLGHGARQRRFHSIRTDRTSTLALELAGSKELIKSILAEHGVPVPAGVAIARLRQLPAAVRRLGFPLVIKPNGGSQGRAVTVGVEGWRSAVGAFLAARLRSRRVVIERRHRGHDYRLLVIDHRFVAAAERIPAQVVGDGRTTIRDLVARLNADPQRGDGHENMLTRVRIDRSTRRLLRRHRYRLDTVLASGDVAQLKGTANLSTGGTSRDVTASVHPETIWMAERISRLFGLDIIGIDVLSPDIGRPLAENGAVVIEVNAGPGLRAHLAPTEGEGEPRDVVTPILDVLFPPGCEARIPLVAVTGTNGKTTTTRLIAHLLAASGRHVGMCTTDGVYVDGRRILKRDAAGPASARALLRDPTIDAAVLEAARGGLLREGLGVSDCDVGVLLNVESDHLGRGGVHTLDDLARVKGAVVEAVRTSGVAVLNAEDPYVCSQSERVRGRLAFFSLDPANPRLQAHVAGGGLAATCEQEELVLLQGGRRVSLGPIADIPLTFGGTAPFMTANLLAATLAGYALGMTGEKIRAALMTFIPSPMLTPGRMNLIPCRDFHVLVDYGHNAPALRALADFVRRWDGERIAVVSLAGDRRVEDYREFGRLCGSTFQRVIVREDYKLRGSRPGETAALIAAGVREAGGSCTSEHIRNEEEATRAALSGARPGALVVLLADDIDATLARVRDFAARLD